MTDLDLLRDSLPYLLSAISRAQHWAEDCAEWSSTIDQVHSKRLAALAAEMAERHAEVKSIANEFGCT